MQVSGLLLLDVADEGGVVVVDAIEVGLGGPAELLLPQLGPVYAGDYLALYLLSQLQLPAAAVSSSLLLGPDLTLLFEDQPVLWGKLLDGEALLEEGNGTAEAVVEGILLVGAGVGTLW